MSVFFMAISNKFNLKMKFFHYTGLLIVLYMRRDALKLITYLIQLMSVQGAAVNTGLDPVASGFKNSNLG